MSQSRLFYETDGQQHATTLIFLHGIAGSSASWIAPFRQLSDHYRVVLIDALGFGRSPKPKLNYSIEDHLNALDATLAHIHQQYPLNTCYLVGHSMGAILAAHWLERLHSSSVSNRLTAPIKGACLLSLPVYRSELEARQRVGNVSTFNRWMALDTTMARATCWLMCHIRPLLIPVMPWFVRDVPPQVAKDSLLHTWWSYSGSLREVVLKADGKRVLDTLHQQNTHLQFIHGNHDALAPVDHVQHIIEQLPQREGVPGWPMHVIEGEHTIVFEQATLCADLLIKWVDSNESTSGVV